MTIIKKEKHEGSKKRLELQNLWKELSTEDLIWLVMNSDQESIQKKAWGKLKFRGELTLSDIYDLTCGPEFIQDELLEIFKKEVNDPEDLLEVMRSVPAFSEMAKKKLFRTIRAKKFRPGRARHFLLRVIEEFPPYRKEAIRSFRELNPSPTEFRKILDMEFMKSDPVIRGMIEELIRKAERKDSRSRRIKKIERLEEQLLKKE